MCQVPLRDVYHYFHYFHYRRPEDVGFVKCLFETNVYNYFHYDRCENVYYLFIAPNSFRPENARFEGITPRRCP